jgi:hypothetical protein
MNLNQSISVAKNPQVHTFQEVVGAITCLLNISVGKDGPVARTRYKLALELIRHRDARSGK